MKVFSTTQLRRNTSEILRDDRQVGIRTSDVFGQTQTREQTAIGRSQIGFEIFAWCHHDIGKYGVELALLFERIESFVYTRDGRYFQTLQGKDLCNLLRKKSVHHRQREGVVCFHLGSLNSQSFGAFAERVLAAFKNPANLLADIFVFKGPRLIG